MTNRKKKIVSLYSNFLSSLSNMGDSALFFYFVLSLTIDYALRKDKIIAGKKISLHDHSSHDQMS